LGVFVINVHSNLFNLRELVTKDARIKLIFRGFTERKQERWRYGAPINTLPPAP